MTRRTETRDVKPGTKQRSRRLQKKLHIGEFQEYGFAVSFRLSASLTPASVDDFWSSFIGQLLEGRGLAYGGGEDAYITRFGRGSATEEDREAVAAWLNDRSGVERVVVRPLTDAWYGHAAD